MAKKRTGGKKSKSGKGGKTKMPKGMPMKGMKMGKGC